MVAVVHWYSKCTQNVQLYQFLHPRCIRLQLYQSLQHGRKFTFLRIFSHKPQLVVYVMSKVTLRDFYPKKGNIKGTSW